MRIEILLFCIKKIDYYFPNDPLYHLISNFNDINAILKIEDKQRLLEFFNINKAIIHNILYNENEIINIEPNEKMKHLSCYIYLNLLINDNCEIINYNYPFCYINEINTERKNIKDKYKELILSVCIISLIKNYLGANNYNEKLEKEIKEMENENKEIIKNNMSNLNNTFGMSLNKEIEIKIDKLYMKIIKWLILNKKFDDYEYTYNILNKIELFNVNLTKEMIDELYKILNEKKKYVIDYLIKSKEDLFNEKKINFHYILLHHVLKKSMYIYHFNFLLKTKKIILENLKKKQLYIIEKKAKDFNKQFKYLIKALFDSEYYLNKYLNNIIEILKEVQTYYKEYLFESKKEDILSIDNIIKNINNKNNINDNNYLNYFQYYELSKKKNLRSPIINYFYIKKNESIAKNEKIFRNEEIAFEKVEKMIIEHKLKKMNKNSKKILYNFINEDEKNKEIITKIIGKNHYDFLINDLNENLNKGEKLNNKKNEFENKNIINKKKENNIINIKSNIIILSDNIQSFNSIDLYSFIGKIIKKEPEQILFLTSINKIVILTDIKQNFKEFGENQYIHVSEVIFSSEKNGIIYFKIQFFSKFKILDKIDEENPINQKIAIRFNLLDYNEFRIKDILFIQIGIELTKDNIIKFKSDKKIIFYVYDASKYDYEYFPQKIYLYDSNKSLDFKFFVYKSFLNEVNLFVMENNNCCYELLYFSLDNTFPEEIEVDYKEKKKFKSSEFHTFNSRTRKSIIFINIPYQAEKDIKVGKNLLNIYLCKEKKIKLYGTFSLDSIKLRATKPYEYKPVIKEKIINIYSDYIECYRKTNNPEKFKKYLLLEPSVIKVLENEINEKFHLYEYENTQFTLDYFNSLCLWNFYYFIKKTENIISLINKYISVYDKIISKKSMNYIEKSMILVGFVGRIFEDKDNFTSPKLFFYDELYESNPYKLAYNFQFKLIENMTESSCLFQPFLFLDSFIMDCLYCKNFAFISSITSAYSISMLPIELIKKHLKKTIKNHFFVLVKEGKPNKRRYYASVQKYNKIITYNENILLRDSKIKKMYVLGKEDVNENPKISTNFAFILNLENIHEISHNKEEIMNIKNSTTLYFDRNLNHSYIYHYDTKNYGEAGKLVDEFIIGGYLIDAIKITKYEMGEYFDVKYFVDTDFKKLFDGFRKVLESCGQKKINKELIYQENYIDSNMNIDLKNCLIIKNKKKTDKNSKKITDEKISIDNKKVEKIFLSLHNTYILSADTSEELIKKIEDMENKKIIVREDAIENNNDICNY